VFGSIDECVDLPQFGSGFLRCGGDCVLDTQGCVGAPPGFCGDGRITDAEQCDGRVFGSIDECVDLPQFG